MHKMTVGILQRQLQKSAPAVQLLHQRICDMLYRHGMYGVANMSHQLLQPATLRFSNTVSGSGGLKAVALYFSLLYAGSMVSFLTVPGP